MLVTYYTACKSNSSKFGADVIPYTNTPSADPLPHSKLQEKEWNPYYQ